MHFVTFKAKRLHLRGVAFGKKVVERVGGMTPARFDLMHVIWKSSELDFLPRSVRFYRMEQDAITRELGLHPSTVSKMVARLQELGWVTRADSTRDRRKKDVALTRLGLLAIERAMRIVFRQRTHLKWFEDFFRMMRPDVHVLDAIHALGSLIGDAARHLGDVARLSYSFGYVGCVGVRDEPGEIASPDVYRARLAYCRAFHAAAAAAEAAPPPPASVTGWAYELRPALFDLGTASAPSASRRAVGAGISQLRPVRVLDDGPTSRALRVTGIGMPPRMRHVFAKEVAARAWWSDALVVDLRAA